MPGKVILIAVSGAMLVSACSSRPRSFEPLLAAAPADQQAYDAQLHTCRQQIAARTDKSGRLVSAAGGAAIGVGAGYAAGTATMAGSAGMIGAAGAAAAAAITVLPIAGLAGAWGISKIKKSKKERAIKTAMADCLQQGGYTVDRWRALSKREARALAAAPSTQPDPAVPAPAAVANQTEPR